MTYGTNGPLGLVPVMYLNGTPYTGATRQYQIASAYATSLFTGDPVVTLADGTIGIGVAGAICRGVFQGCKYTTAAGIYTFGNYWPASTSVLTGSTAYALIADDPNLVFDVQETSGTGTAGTPLALADRGLNINFYAGAGGSTRTGNSSFSIDNATEATTATLNLKIIDLATNPNNVVGSFANWFVCWNAHQLKSVGVSGV